jgi:hypothetical protein
MRPSLKSDPELADHFVCDLSDKRIPCGVASGRN